MTEDGISLGIGGAAVGAICGVVGAWIKARFAKMRVEPDPLRVEKAEKPVSRKEFEDHVAEDKLAHENLYARMNRNDRETSEIKGLLHGIREDIGLIKAKLFKSPK